MKAWGRRNRSLWVGDKGRVAVEEQLAVGMRQLALGSVVTELAARLVSLAMLGRSSGSDIEGVVVKREECRARVLKKGTKVLRCGFSRGRRRRLHGRGPVRS